MNGTNETGTMVFGSYRTNNGLTSVIAIKNEAENATFLEFPTMPNNGYLGIDSKIKWLDCEKDNVQLEITKGPTIKFRIVNRDTLLKCFKKYKATSNPASEEVINQIKEYVSKEDQLPDNAKLLLTTTYSNIYTRAFKY